MSYQRELARPFFMTQYRYTVEEVFAIHERGIALVGFENNQYDYFHVGEQIELKRPDGSMLYTKIIGVEYPPSIKWIGTPPADARYGLIVDLPFDEVPIGSEVWI